MGLRSEALDLFALSTLAILGVPREEADMAEGNGSVDDAWKRFHCFSVQVPVNLVFFGPYWILVAQSETDKNTGRQAGRQPARQRLDFSNAAGREGVIE